MRSAASVAPIRVRRTVDREVAASTGLTMSGLFFFLLGASFLTVTMLAASIAPGYDFSGAAISDLGVIDETALLFNGLLVSIGILNVAGGYLFYRSHGRTWLLAIYVVAGIGALGAGLFPLDTGGPHSIFALIAFLFYNIEAAATAAVVHGPMRIVSAAAGVVGLAFLVVMIFGDAGNPAVFGAIGHGGAERMIAYPAMVWLLTLGGYLMAVSPVSTRIPGNASRDTYRSSGTANQGGI